MNEIKCPKCGTSFKIDESGYELIVKQIRDKEFNKELEIRDEQHKIDKESSIKLALANKEKETDKIINEKLIEISNLKNEISNKEELVRNSESKKYIEEINNKNIEINKLNNEIKNIKDALENKLKLQESENKLKIANELSKRQHEIDDLNNKLEITTKEFIIKEKNIKDSYEEKLKDKEEQILYYKDFKAKQSTKMIGESLEQHCYNEFNTLRPLFKNCYFEKDNDIKTGSKGDFIFRDFSDDGLETVSIMFEMKNEADLTATKHKNEDFFKELDKDRREKKCEYAVLVSLLEIDNDYYNNGIVDVSYKYDKMYVIRPQFFIPLITLIRSMALNSLKYKQELEIIQNQNIDISHFEENMNNFKESFGRNYRIASEKFKKAIDEIDKTIDHLQKTKDALISSENNLRIANNKTEDLTIKKLTKNSESVLEMFEELKKETNQ